MGTIINMVSVARPRFRFSPGNSIRLSVKAARQCLEDAGVNPGHLGFLINTGIYRHKNMGEPAIAALIMEKICPHKARKNDTGNFTNTFSFDLNNGGCGFLSGIEIVQGMINKGEISHGMVVTGDSEPFHGLSEEFSFSPAAGAVIMSGSSGSRGFFMFKTYSFPEYCEELISRTYYSSPGVKMKGKNVLHVFQKKSYSDLCVECAAKSLLAFLVESGKTLRDIDLIITSQSPLGFTNGFRNRTGLNNKIIEVPVTGKKVFHTAGIAFALKKTWEAGLFNNAKNIVFLTVGSGITVSVALYKN